MHVIKYLYTRRTSLFVLFCMMIISGGCSKRADRDVIAGHIDAMIEAVEKENRRALLKYFSEDVVVQKRLGKRDVGALAFRYFLAYDNIKLYVYFINIKSESGQGQARVSAKVLVTSGKEVLPQRAGLYQVSGRWQKTGDDWLIIELDWQRLQIEKLAD